MCYTPFCSGIKNEDFNFILKALASLKLLYKYFIKYTNLYSIQTILCTVGIPKYIRYYVYLLYTYCKIFCYTPKPQK